MGQDGSVPDLVRELCAWFAAHRRELPWRASPDPYRVWISEAMLQQTRVETVIPYFERFLVRLPDVRSLAEAEEEEVLALWSGLGYYRRARALHAAARVVVERHDGVFPRTREAWLALPGVGPYTAGAVLSIAFDEREALVDGNVARVLCRLFGLELDPRSGPGARELWRRAEALVPAAPEEAGTAVEITPGTWNQGLMELGALVCTPRSPSCEACPWNRRCVARAEGREQELPRLPPREPARDVRLEVLLVHDGERCLLQRRPPSGRMAGMWELPTRELAGASGERYLWPAEHAAALEDSLRVGDALGSVRHTITRHRIEARVHRARAHDTRDALAGVGDAERRWADPAQRAELALTGMTRKILARFG